MTLHGLGGGGKTQLARYYTFHPVQTYSLIAWFSAASLKELDNDYESFIRTLGIELKGKYTPRKYARCG